MKFARYRATGRGGADGERWGVVDTDARTVQPIDGAFEEWAPAVTVGGPGAVTLGSAPVSLDTVTLLPPLRPTSEITGLGYNYASFVVPAEGADPPVYTKPMASIVGPDATIEFPDLIAIQPQCRFCYEIQLVAVVGSVRIGDPKHATRDLLGYTIGNDGALRGTRPSFVGMDLFGERSSYQSSALGPWIVTTDELGGDGQPDLELTTTVNGAVTQKGRTSEMRWGVDQVLEEMNNRSMLSTGDVVFTGTCGYVGIPDGHYLAGDVIDLAVEGIGTLHNVVAATDPFPMHPSQRWGGDTSLPGVHPVGTRGGS
jgi:2-keto-4-pentenoate hydratase/2-oxohepta-3-ene-1,7-dioic acid hydratase in catechol pathway